MPGFRHILFPVDFSERSKAVRPFVEQYARQFSSKLTLLNVLQVPPGMIGGVDASFPVMFDYPSLAGQVDKLLRDYMEPGALPGEVAHAVEVGDPATVIGDFARHHDVDLIMMPTHGYGRFRSLLLGSVVSKVLHDVDCAVWTAPHTEASDFLGHLSCRNMLAALDLDDGQESVLSHAVELAREFGASLRLVHAVPGAERHPGETGGEEFSLFLLKTGRTGMEKLQREAGTALEATVEAGSAASVIRAVALEQRTDLLVIGRGAMHQTFGRLRSESYAIIRESPCPVLSL